MKTSGLTFLEAVQALKDGKCESIQSPGGVHYHTLNTNAIVPIENTVYGPGIMQSPSTFLGKWKLIGVKQKFVVNDVTWAKHDCGVVYPASFQDMPDWTQFLNKPGMKMTLEWPE